MPRIQIVADDGRVTLDERIRHEDLSSAHFRRCLVERVDWAVADAQETGHERLTFERPAEPLAAAA